MVINLKNKRKTVASYLTARGENTSINVAHKIDFFKNSYINANEGETAAKNNCRESKYLLNMNK